MNRMARTFVALAAVLVAGACVSADTSPFGPVTVLVHNSTCDTGTCTPVRVLVFPDAETLTPNGSWTLDLGVLSTASGCFELPPSATFTVSGPEGVEARFNWGPTQRTSLGAILPGQGALQASPNTTTFVPAESRGWTVDLPSGATLERGPACTPLVPPA